MQTSLTLISKAMKSQFKYLNVTITGLISSILRFIINISLWYTLINSGVREDIGMEEIVLYLLVNAFIVVISDCDLSSEIETLIRDGSISLYLLRPLSLKQYLFCSMAGKTLYKCILNVLPVVFLAGVMTEVAALPNMQYFLIFGISLAIGLLIIFEIIYIFGLLAFVLQRTWYLKFYIGACLSILGGTVVPMWFYPQWLNHLSYFFPFRYIAFEPINIFLMKNSLTECFYGVGISAVWLLVLWAIDKLLWKHIDKRITINGG